MLKIQALASGSKGNCTYIASETTNLLVDIGLSLSELTRRMQLANIEPEKINAILITHEHIDHIKGVAHFLRKYNCKLYLHKAAESAFTKHIRQRGGHFPDEQLITYDKVLTIGDITVDFFPVSHDSEFCFGYTFQKESCKISLATDLGRAVPEILAKMANSQVILLESNHDLVKLQNNVKYPPILKRRISGSTGHLSNAAASLAIYELVKTNVQQIILAHLSEQNNSPSLAYTFVRDFLARKGLQEGVDISIDVATQDTISKLFQID